MDFRIDEDDRLLRETLRRTLEEAAPPPTRRAAGTQPTDTEPTDRQPADTRAWRQLASAGWFGGFVADAEGPGDRLPAVRGVGLAEEFGCRPMSEPIAMTAGFLLPLLSSLPTASGRRLAGEVGAGALVAAAPTAHVPVTGDDGVWGFGQGTPVLRAEDGGVALCGGVPDVELPPDVTTLCTPARTEDGQPLVVAVPFTAKGLDLDVHDTIVPGRHLADIELDDVPVEDAQVVGRGQDIVGRAVDRARVAYGLFLDGQALGGAQAVIDRSLSYAKEREQFGVPIGSFQAVKHLIADAAVALEGARSLTYHLAWEVEEHGWDAAIEGLAASRINASRMYREVADMGIQVRGATGFTWEDGAHRWLRAATFDALQATDGKRLERALATHLIDGPSDGTRSV